MSGLMAISSATLTSSQLHSSLRGFRPPPHPLWLRVRPSLPGLHSSRGLRVSATAALSVEQETRVQHNDSMDLQLLACPICYEPLTRKGPAGLNLPSIYRSGFKCQKCNKSFTSKDVYLDLTITSGTTEYSEFKPARTELFRSPLVSFLYERGWRQNFNRSGFPGLDEEFNMAQEYFKPVTGGLLVDVSCGSGLFSRKFAKSGSFSAVVALDFSENMLRQCYEFIKQDDTLITTNLALVRADVSRLPFASGSIDAVHAGAALHCWPSPSNAVAEITRVLRSGGVFVATTFLVSPLNTPLPLEAFRSLRQSFGQVTNSYNYFTEKEIEDLCRSCGLINYTSTVQRSFIIICAVNAGHSSRIGDLYNKESEGMMAFGRAQAILMFATISLHSAVAGLQETPVSGAAEDVFLISPRRSANSPARILVENTSFVLAADRTRRRDPLNGFKLYTGGWNISDLHYLASVGFTAAPLFAVTAVWFFGFALVLSLICCCFCCFPRRSCSFSRTTYALAFALLILFTAATIVGCVVLFHGQDKFHGTTSNTLDFVVGQSNTTVSNLRNLSTNLADAKKVGVGQISLPADEQAAIDAVVQSLNDAAGGVSSRTADNSKRIRDYLDTVHLVLIILVAAVLLLVLLGLTFSILGLQFLVNICVLVGWVLVAATFFLSGLFLLLHNAVADTCVSMDEWALHPREHTAMDDILPCVDVATTNASLRRSREVTFQLVNVVNQVVTNVSNADFPPMLKPLYYNQSGPLVPPLCNPYDPDLGSRSCTTGELGFNNVSRVWRSYVCQVTVVNGSDICATVGRITPKIYAQMMAAVNVSYGLYQYGPFLTGLADCTFVRQTFRSITLDHCPGLGRYSKQVFIGLAMASAAVMLSLVLWVIYARARWHRKRNKQLLARSYHEQQHLQEKYLLGTPRSGI
ncbi:hypothetical protein MUK42_26957 [Musa troglodytarum]|uniref:Methyltransferase type 11 domain-containing protein n=1 Tax=Musa troglodytarum TaxID=320322 RepID=A0A9E7JNU7_9LILI|nr:hypothetical protein MUK42_26957 [Musa troglodytarum]